MRQRNTMSVRKQLGLAFGLLAALVLLVALVAVRSLSVTNESFTNYNATVAAQSQLANRLADAVNDRAVAARNLVLVTTTQDVELEKVAVTKAHENTQTLLQQLKAAVQQTGVAEQRVMVDRIAEIESRYGPVALDIVGKALRGERNEAIEKMNTECRPLLAALLAALKQYVEANTKEGDASVQAAETRYGFARLQLLGASVVAIIAAIMLGGWITRNLFAALGGEPQDAVRLARAVAQGNLTTDVRLRGGDTFSLMAQLQTMQESLAGVVANVRHNAKGVAFSSETIEDGNSDLKARTESQASALEETAAAMDELGSTVRQNADNAMSANQLAMAASKVATQGGAVVGRVVDTMKGINESSQRIADIIGVIDSIAFQTNILALNAAVEAARAGEQGRGFAVVAGEVRTLAQRSASAAREIKELITASVEQTEKGSRLVDKAGSTMDDVVSSIRRVTDIMGEISAASNEQSTGVREVAEAIVDMDHTTQQNAALVEHSAQGARDLRERAGELVRAVEVFRLPEHMIENEDVVRAHRESPLYKGRRQAPVLKGRSARSHSGGAQSAAHTTTTATSSAVAVADIEVVEVVAESRAKPQAPSKPAADAGGDWETF